MIERKYKKNIEVIEIKDIMAKTETDIQGKAITPKVYSITGSQFKDNPNTNLISAGSKPTLLNYKEQQFLPVISSKKMLPRIIPFPVKVQTMNDQIDMKKAKRYKGMRKKHKKNHYKSHRLIPPMEPAVERKILDGFLLLHSCRVKNPQQAIKSRLNGENIVEVEEGDLLFFPNLAYLNISENKIRIEQLNNLKGLTELYMQYNFIKSLQITPGIFPLLEILSLGFNSIPPGHILQLAQLPNLRVLDLSGNELCILPEELSSFAKLEEFDLSSNNFSSDSVVVEPGKLFKSLSTIPRLKRLNLSRNALKGFHFEYLSSTNLFEALTELDFSYNRISNQENLLFCQKLKSLQAVIITGNPIGISGEYKELEQIIYTATSAVVVNHAIPPPNYLKKVKEKKADLYKKFPYPKPIASIVSDNAKAIISKHDYEVELSKGISVTLGEIEPSKEGDEEIFPEGTQKNRQATDIFTPPEAAQREKKLFLTEDDILTQPQMPKGKPDFKHEDRPQEISPEEKESVEKIQIEGEAEEDEENYYGENKYANFLEECREYLGNTKEYTNVFPISTACACCSQGTRS